MNEIQDEAYTEACQEIEMLKQLNVEERLTIDSLSLLIERLCDALDCHNLDHLNDDLIREAREQISR